MSIASPMNEEELRNMMYTAQLDNMGPFVIRYPRGNGVMKDWRKPFKALEIGKGRLIKNGERLAIITIGHVGNYAVDACKELEKENINIAHYDLRFLKPLDEELLHQVFQKFKYIITIEDGTIIGGMGSAIIEFMNDNGYSASIKRLGVPDHFIEHGSMTALRTECKYSTQDIIETAREILISKSTMV
jgi:1-deoxy-D-xylulose-5-phosphate synthase